MKELEKAFASGLSESFHATAIPDNPKPGPVLVTTQWVMFDQIGSDDGSVRDQGHKVGCDLGRRLGESASDRSGTLECKVSRHDPSPGLSGWQFVAKYTTAGASA